MLVDLTHITKVGPITSHPYLDAYDATWGFYTFGQSLEMVFNDAHVYRSQGVFTLNGVFTATAEGLDPDNDPDAALLALSSKYDALEAMLSGAATQEEPAEMEKWGTADDPRCVPLPGRLKGPAGATIYAQAERLVLTESRMPLEVRYQAVLREPLKPESTILVNDVPLRSARITVTPPTPMVTRHRMIAGEGSLINVSNFTRTEVSITGIVPHAAGVAGMSDRAKSLAESLTDGFMTVKLVRWIDGAPITQTLYTHIRVDQPSVHTVPKERGTEFSVRGKV